MASHTSSDHLLCIWVQIVPFNSLFLQFSFMSVWALHSLDIPTFSIFHRYPLGFPAMLAMSARYLKTDLRIRGPLKGGEKEVVTQSIIDLMIKMFLFHHQLKIRACKCKPSGYLITPCDSGLTLVLTTALNLCPQPLPFASAPRAAAIHGCRASCHLVARGVRTVAFGSARRVTREGGCSQLMYESYPRRD
jgi:hypothetical protein